MNYRKLGSTGLLVSEIGFGTIPILQGNIPVLPDYFNLNEKEALAVMEYAYKLGCNLYDTAIVPEYGDAEIKLGKFAASIGREHLVISDKARFLAAVKCIRQLKPPAKILAQSQTYILSIKWMQTTRKKCLDRVERLTRLQN